MPPPVAPSSSGTPPRMGHAGGGLKGALAKLGPHGKPVAVVGAGALGGLILIRMKKKSSAPGGAAATTAAGTAANVAGGDPYGLAQDVTNSIGPEIESLQQQITRLQGSGITGATGAQGPPGVDGNPGASGTPILAPGSGVAVPTPTPALPSIQAQFINAVTAGTTKAETGALIFKPAPPTSGGGGWASLGPAVATPFAGNSGSTIPSWLHPS